MASLTLLIDGSTREIELPGQLTIGRDPTNALVLNDPGVSRFHCRLQPDGSGFELEDLGSASGTRVDGQRIGRCPLRDGQRIAVGAVKLVFHDRSTAAAHDPTPSSRVLAEPSHAEQPTYGLYATAGPRQGTVFTIAGAGLLRIGRGPACELQLDGAGVSTVHCEVLLDAASITLRDAGSTHGTLVDGQAVTEVVLLPGQQLTIGEHELLFAPYPYRERPAWRNLAAWGIELAVLSAMGLLLWALAARLVVWPLLGKPLTPTAIDPAVVPFTDLDRSSGRSRYYDIEVFGSWQLSIEDDLAQVAKLRVRSDGNADSELRLMLLHALDVGEGWRVVGAISAQRGAARAALFARYYDADERPLGTLYSAAIELEGDTQQIAASFPPLAKSRWIRVGYWVDGRCRDAVLAPLRLASEHNPPLGEATLARGAVRLAISALAETRLACGDQALCWLEPCEMEASQGQRISSLRELAAPRLGGANDMVRWAAQQVHRGQRLPVAVEARWTGEGLAWTVEQGAWSHLRWEWLAAPIAPAMYFKGASPAAAGRLLFDELTTVVGQHELTIRFTPPIYLEARWLNRAGHEIWQLRPVERSDRVELEIFEGNRRRQRELVRQRGQYDRALQRGDLPVALRHLRAWQALEPDPRELQLEQARMALHGQIAEALAPLLVATGDDAIEPLLQALAAYRGSTYEEQLELALISRVRSDLVGGDALALAGSLHRAGRRLMANEYWALARAALTLQVQLVPDAAETASSLRLLSALPR